MTNNNEEKRICCNCEQSFNEDEMHYVDGEWYCDECFDEFYTVCDCCGDIVDRAEARLAPNGDNYCESCFDDNCTYCDHCGDAIWRDDVEVVNIRYDGCDYESEDWCISCARYHATRCDCCGDWFIDGHGLLTDVSNGDTVCDNCLDNDSDYVRCEECGAWCHIDDAHQDDDGDWYCDDCYDDERDGTIFGYHNYPSGHHWYRLQRPNETDRYKFLHFGIELEIDRGGESCDKAKAIKEAFNIRDTHDITCMHDGSLNNGFELISQPATLQYHLKDYGWRQAMKKAETLGYVSHNGGTCGLHVHVDREYFRGAFENPEDSFIILTQNNLDWLKQFSRRKNWGYCEFQNINGFEFTPESFKSTDENSSLEYIEKVRRDNRGHGVAMNYAGNATIEFRFFRGTLKFQTFAASLQLVEMMCYAAKHFRKEQLCNVNLKWFKRFAVRRGYSEFNAYIKERGIVA